MLFKSPIDQANKQLNWARQKSYSEPTSFDVAPANLILFIFFTISLAAHLIIIYSLLFTTMTLSSNNSTEKDEERPLQNKYAPTEQNADLPTDLGSLQDIFSFSFMRGRAILNCILAILWSIGLPILIYQLLKPRIGQILAMIAVSSPPLAITIV